MTEILPRLFLGNEADSRDLGTRVGCVVNCTSNLPFHQAQGQAQAQIRVPVEDNGDPRQQPAFVELAPAAVAAVVARLADPQGGTVLVHCAAGRQRSAALVAAVLVRMRACATVDEAVALVAKKKRDAFFGGVVNFRPALDALFATLSSTRTTSHLVFEESGEREDYDWRILGTFEGGSGRPEREHDALLFAWRHALAHPRASVSVHAWDAVDGGPGTSCGITHLRADLLRGLWVDSLVADVAASLEAGVIPDALHAGFTTRVYR
jgi:hypothetical protein